MKLFVNFLNNPTSDHQRDGTVSKFSRPLWFHILVVLGTLSLTLWFQLIGCFLFKILARIKANFFNERQKSYADTHKTENSKYSKTISNKVPGIIIKPRRSIHSENHEICHEF